MKKFYSKYCKYIFSLLLIGIIVLTVGILIAIFAKDKLLNLKISLIAVSGFITIFTPVIYFAERSRWIAITDDVLILPRGVEIIWENGIKNCCIQRTELPICEIASVTRKLHKGDGIIILDTYYYSFIMKDNNSYTLPLFSYDESALNQIFDILLASGVKKDF